MPKSEDEIRREIKAHIDKEGGKPSSWYAGIAADAEDRVFKDHGVRREGAWWIYHPCSSADVARKVEKYLVDQVGTDGAPGGGDENSKMVYAYKKGANTDP